jgi:SAM-dependent methyltransferase
VPDSSPWSGWVNAEVYDDYVRHRPLYLWLNRHLVELAGVGAARRVLDLACGTGATARAVLALLPADGELVGVDASPAMVGVARARVTDRRARFEVAAAAEVATVAAGPFDRVLCNAAFLQFPDRAAVLAGLAGLMPPGALFAFSLPAARITGEAAQVHPFQVALQHQVRERGGGGASGAGGEDDFDPARLAGELEEAGFAVVEYRRLVYHGLQEELMELMEIPAMMARAAPRLAAGERGAALAAARLRTDEAQSVEVPWLFWLARRS